MDLVKAGETAKVEILGETFNVKVMSPYDAAEWAQKCNGDNKQMIDAMCEKIVSIDGQDHKPIEILKHLRKVDDIVLIVKAIIEASGLSDTEAKNSNSSSESATTNSSEVVEKTADEVESPVSITREPKFS